MIIDRISYTTSIPIAPYGIKDVISAEASLQKGEDTQEAFRILVAYVEGVRNEKYPHLYGPGSKIQVNPEYAHLLTSALVSSKQPEEPESPYSLEEEIELCRDLENLKSCKFLINATKDEVQKRKLLLLYDTKLEILKKQTELAR